MFPSGSPLSEWLAWLETLSPTEINLGLSRTQSVLKRLQLPLPSSVLLIAGTNGKGSSVAMTDALLRASGMRTGAYTSPHISRYNERIVIDGVAADDTQIVAAFEQVEAVRGDTELTYFEFGTIAAAVLFAAANLDVWILEVGLGGRLDATNAIEPTASLITNVSLDHCDWLGDDIEAIAAEKAGVMRTGIPTVYGGDNIPRSVVSQANDCGAKLLQAGEDFEYEIGDAGIWSWRGPASVYEALQPPGLPGEFQTGNAAAVLMLLEAAGLADKLNVSLINQALSGLTLAGRMQHLSVAGLEKGGSEWLIDVAHNPAAAEVLSRALGAMQSDGSVMAIVGLLDDKDLKGMIGPLAPHVDLWIAMTADSRRAIPANELARQVANLTGRACLVAESAADAVEFARRRSSENDRILATGSFFTVAPVLQHLAAL